MENKPCHFLEKLLITNAIYQLNKYNKAWLNKNLAKTPTSFRNCLKYSENRNIQSDFPYNCKFIAKFGFIYTPGFLYETGFLPGLKFSTSHIICVVSVRFSSLSELIDSERKSLDFEGRSWNRGKCCDIQTYIHTYIHILVFWVRGMYFVERSIHLIEEHLHTAGFGHRQPRLVTSKNLELTYLRYLLYPC